MLLRERLLTYWLFRYGQTGTGKTYTMEGQYDSGHSVLDQEAGIIPRTLRELFTVLERQGADYSIKVSFIELYNEELRDLLADKDEGKLRIFDDAAHKGVFVQGVEEVAICKKDDVLNMLGKASAKRRTAATWMNQTSSRSHSVFTITVHMRDTDEDGEELLKIGKLNLVDLAGSENIGRSGALDKRAREAGVINQSLLTLGRVINALVDKSAHIPYRESKLTRILQDSLGGRAKTCIIATLSPAKCNLEETLSTLEYAHRAKNIRNRPEMNARMSKKALIKDYIAEVERLKMELQLTRDKNGVYVSPEVYEQMTLELQQNRALVDELHRGTETQRAYVMQLERDLSQRDQECFDLKKELGTVKADLTETQRHLAILQADLASARESLDKERERNAQLAALNGQLHFIGTQFARRLVEAMARLEALRLEVERKAHVDREKRNLMTAFHEIVAPMVARLQSETQEMVLSESKAFQEIFGRIDAHFGPTMESVCSARFDACFWIDDSS